MMDSDDDDPLRDPQALDARRFLITGQVQGVGFRYFVRKRARALGLEGWVRNLPDGSVEVHVEGPAEQVDGVLTAIGRGPAGAEVEAVEVIETEPLGVTGFEVRG